MIETALEEWHKLRDIVALNPIACAVLDVHAPDRLSAGIHCEECVDSHGVNVSWPCRTYLAIDDIVKESGE